jgi:hypothetical protein
VDSKVNPSDQDRKTPVGKPTMFCREICGYPRSGVRCYTVNLGQLNVQFTCLSTPPVSGIPGKTRDPSISSPPRNSVGRFRVTLYRCCPARSLRRLIAWLHCLTELSSQPGLKSGLPPRSVG